MTASYTTSLTHRSRVGQPSGEWKRSGFLRWPEGGPAFPQVRLGGVQLGDHVLDSFQADWLPGNWIVIDNSWGHEVAPGRRISGGKHLLE